MYADLVHTAPSELWTLWVLVHSSPGEVWTRCGFGWGVVSALPLVKCGQGAGSGGVRVHSSSGEVRTRWVYPPGVRPVPRTSLDMVGRGGGVGGTQPASTVRRSKCGHHRPLTRRPASSRFDRFVSSLPSVRALGRNRSAAGDSGAPCGSQAFVLCRLRAKRNRRLRLTSMDELAALECAVVEVPPSASSSTGAGTHDGVASECGSRASTKTPPRSSHDLMARSAKRRRNGLLSVKGEVLTPRATKVETPGEPGDDDGPSELGCRGCGRFLSTSRDFFDLGGPTMWGSSTGRGRWCRECHSLWRSVYQGPHPLPFMKDFLEEAPNRRTWGLHLLSSLTLAKEGGQRITAQMVQQRSETLQWVFRLAGVPVHASQVVPLHEAVARGDSIDPAMFVNMEQNGAACLGVFVPACTDSAASSAHGGPSRGRRHGPRCSASGRAW